VSLPQREFNTYSDAFTETKTVTEQLLLEYDVAKRAEAERKQPAPTSTKLTPPYPSHVTLADSVHRGALKDPVVARREALEVVSHFNSVLVRLAEGKKPEEVKSITASLIDGLNNVGSLVGQGLAIPFAGQISSLISTVVSKLQEVENRKQFVAALREAEPIIQSILDLFMADAQDIYQIRARQTDRLWTDYQDKVAALVRQMRDVAAEHAKPSGDYASKLAESEKQTRTVLDRVGLKENSEKLSTGGKKSFDELALSQLQQTLVQAKFEAERYDAVIKEQVAFHKLVISYGMLLEKTKSSLTTLRLALDSPVDIRQQAIEMISFAFAVKRDFEALNAARRAADNH
jgi:hypothetical protein